MPVDVVRDAAVDILLRVFEQDAFLNIALDAKLRRGSFAPRGRRFLTQLVYGTVRHKALCDFVLARLLRQPIEDLPPPIRAILRMGIFQGLFCNQVEPFAMVHTSVELARKRGHIGTARLTNAVLRRAPQSVDDIALPDRQADLLRHLAVRHSMPEWLVARWIRQFGPEEAESLCAALNEEAPSTLRVNTLTAQPEALAARLTKAGCVVAKRTPVLEELTLEEGVPARSKAFQEGDLFPQDPAAMLAAHLVEPRPGERVLDLCAAPGGKTTHLAALAEGRAEIVAADIHPGKLRLVDENRRRLGAPGIRLLCADGRRPPLADESFDAVLVDAPCSGHGTLRRHPDLKWRIEPEAPDRLAEVQLALLRAAKRLCKNGGRIVYSVCTFTPEETEAVACAFESAEAVKPENGPDWLRLWNTKIGRYEILPHRDRMDGFFLTRWRKSS